MLDINFAQIFISYIVLLFSLTVHEMAHAWTADRLGDPTARLLGRISLNPVVHAAALGGAVANVPRRVLADLTAPARVDLARNVRRAVGLGRAPISMSMDPAESYLPPEGVARMVHADLPSMLIGGIPVIVSTSSFMPRNKPFSKSRYAACKC